jgi:sulfur-oxidizing protein SoxY
LLTPRSILAAWPQSAFEAKSVDAALSAAVGSDKTEASSDITVKAPDIAENGAVVPITVTSTFELGEGTEAFISTRIKMGKTSNVLAIVKADGKLYSAKKEVKVTIGGCGG